MASSAPIGLEIRNICSHFSVRSLTGLGTGVKRVAEGWDRELQAVQGCLGSCQRSPPTVLPALDSSRVVPPLHHVPPPSWPRPQAERRRRERCEQAAGPWCGRQRWLARAGEVLAGSGISGGTRFGLDTRQSSLDVNPCSVGRNGTTGCFHYPHPTQPPAPVQPESARPVFCLPLAAPTPSSAWADSKLHGVYSLVLDFSQQCWQLLLLLSVWGSPYSGAPLLPV